MSNAQALSNTPTTSEDMHDHSLMSLSFATFLLAVVLFIASLFLPVFITQTNDIQGYWILAMGWLGFVAFQFAWYAAPFAILAVYISRKSPQFGLVLSVIAILMASEAFLFTEVPFGKNDKVLDYGSGFYVWYLCFYLVSLSILLRLIAWGKIVDDNTASVSDSSNSQSKVMSGSQWSHQNPIRPVAVKATRKIITQEKITRNTTLPNWGKQTPPPLPKNIYQPKERNNGKGKSKTEVTEYVATSEPPSLTVKKKQFIKPPPLPSWYKSVISRPPPLPDKNLGIAPFLDK